MMHPRRSPHTSRPIPHVVVRFPRPGVEGPPFIFKPQPSRSLAQAAQRRLVKRMANVGRSDSFTFEVIPVAQLAARGLSIPGTEA